MSNLEGKTAVVTGCASGLGAAISAEFVAEGARVLGVDRNAQGGRTTMRRLGKAARFRVCDVSNESDVRASIAEAVSAFGRLDVMVNNAAIQLEKELHDTSEAEWDSIQAVNLKGVFFGCKHAVIAMRTAQKGGSIVNVASILALVGDPILPAYGAMKGGVLALTRSMAAAYGPEGIRANAICPGDIATPMVEKYFAAADDPQTARNAIEIEYPLRRIAQPVEIARVVVFLASDSAAFVNGHALVADGGLLADCY